MKPPSTCHPEREHYAHGKCHPCYLSRWRERNHFNVKGYRATYRAKNPDTRKRKTSRRASKVRHSILADLGR